jgi:endonuclease YncB( thermonuclease family)
MPELQRQGGNTNRRDRRSKGVLNDKPFGNICTACLIVFCISAALLSLVPSLVYLSSVDARCQNGFHQSPSGDCERVTHSGGLPRCDDGFHRSPDGDCERVSSGNSDNGRSPDAEDDVENDDDRESEVKDEEVDEEGNGDKISVFNSHTPVSQSTECKGSADCFRAIVTKIVDGDTLDVNNVRVRLALINTPEVGEGGYDEAKEFTESECSVGSEALVDEDDGQKAGSFGRLIGTVYCNGNSSSLNELLLETDNAVLYEDFCGVSEFSNDGWVTTHGC